LNKEDYFISLFNNKFLGDDGAVIKNQIISKDLFCEGIHFKREWMSLREIAIKSILVNVSFANMRELKSGFDFACSNYNITIIGGDTVAGDKLDISITLISKTKNPIRRKGMKKGDYL